MTDEGERGLVGEPDIADIREGLGGGQFVLREAAVAYGVGFDDDLEYQIHAGLPVSSMEFMMQRYGISGQEMAQAMKIPERTFARRRKEARLQPDESDRLARLARILGRAKAVLGDDRAAADWIHRRNRALGGRTPLSMVDTDLGSRRVEAVLGRIEHGVFS